MPDAEAGRDPYSQNPQYMDTVTRLLLNACADYIRALTSTWPFQLCAKLDVYAKQVKLIKRDKDIMNYVNKKDFKNTILQCESGNWYGKQSRWR